MPLMRFWFLVVLGFAPAFGIAGDVLNLHGRFESARRKIDFDEYRLRDASIAPLVLLLHGSSGLNTPNFPFAELGHRLALDGFVVIAPHYLNATGGSSRNPEARYKDWVRVVGDAVTYFSARPSVARE